MSDQMKLNDRGMRVLMLAKDEAVRFNHNYIGTEHLLLGLLREGGKATQILIELGIMLDNARQATEFIIGKGDRFVIGKIGLTPRGKKTIELAAGAAAACSHESIGPEHILLGLVSEGEGIAAGVCESLGVNLERIRAKMIKVLSDPKQREIGNAPGRLSWIELVQGNVKDWYSFFSVTTKAERFHEDPSGVILEDGLRFYAELPIPTEQMRRILLLREDVGYRRLLTEYFSPETPAERKAVLEEEIGAYKLAILLTGRPQGRARWQTNDR